MRESNAYLVHEVVIGRHIEELLAGTYPPEQIKKELSKYLRNRILEAGNSSSRRVPQSSAEASAPSPE